jgi:hypothetical protein
LFRKTLYMYNKRSHAILLLCDLFSRSLCRHFNHLSSNGIIIGIFNLNPGDPRRSQDGMRVPYCSVRYCLCHIMRISIYCCTFWSKEDWQCMLLFAIPREHIAVDSSLFEIVVSHPLHAVVTVPLLLSTHRSSIPCFQYLTLRT